MAWQAAVKQQGLCKLFQLPKLTIFSLSLSFSNFFHLSYSHLVKFTKKLGFVSSVDIQFVFLSFFPPPLVLLRNIEMSVMVMIIIRIIYEVEGHHKSDAK